MGVIQQSINQLFAVGALVTKGLEDKASQAVTGMRNLNDARAKYINEEMGGIYITDKGHQKQVEPGERLLARAESQTDSSLAGLKNQLAVEKRIGAGYYDSFSRTLTPDEVQDELREKAMIEFEQKSSYEYFLEEIKNQPTSLGSTVGELPENIQKQVIQQMWEKRGNK